MVSVPGAIATAAVDLAVRMLPDLDDRLRYRGEFTADLAVLGRAGQLRYAAGVLSQTFALRAALGTFPNRAEEAAMTAPTTRRASVRCRVLRRHRWVARSTDDGERYTACARCGRIRDELFPRRSGEGSGDTAKFLGLPGSGGLVGFG